MEIMLNWMGTFTGIRHLYLHRSVFWTLQSYPLQVSNSLGKFNRFLLERKKIINLGEKASER